MPEMKIEQLIREADLSKALKTSRDTLLNFRSKGCPWVSIGGRVFYHEQEFMEWLLKTQKRVSDAGSP
jgi:phage terminase Nu1 subunit (DNA packaging protein)